MLRDRRGSKKNFGFACRIKGDHHIYSKEGIAGIISSRPFEMTDVHDKKIRSFNMSRIRSKDTKSELLVRKFVFAKGFR